MPAYGEYAGPRGAEYAPPMGPPPGEEYRAQETYVEEKKEENHDKRNMLLAAAGGLAVGGIGAAIVAEALGNYDVHYRIGWLFQSS